MIKKILAVALFALTVSVMAEHANEPLFIPGITPKAISIELINRGFLASETYGQRDGDLNINRWSTTGLFDSGKSYSHSVTIKNYIGTEQIYSVSVETSEYTPDNKPSKEAKELLKFIAAIPYTSAKPEQARQWISANISKDDLYIESLNINDVVFSIYNTGRATRTMNIYYSPSVTITEKESSVESWATQD